MGTFLPSLSGASSSDTSLAAGTSTTFSVGDAATLSDPTENLTDPASVCAAVQAALLQSGNYSSVSISYSGEVGTSTAYLGSFFTATVTLVNVNSYDTDSEEGDIQSEFNNVLEGNYTPQNISIASGGNASQQNLIGTSTISGFGGSILSGIQNAIASLESAGQMALIALVALVIILLVIAAYHKGAFVAAV
jgi:hypothetical protein